ncbi:hypothetical protein [Actinopolyspora halophila]|uniref:hypothetical protein n=1 Tax=Actinopolyspora halophila TaxID=1850 RepID=UPI0003A3F16F|nr:hypothetical protein [Actinopolyspora halophila]
MVLLSAVGVGLWARTFYGNPTASHDRVPEIPSFPNSAQDAPGSQRVSLEKGARSHPDSGAVRDLLQQHFDAINQRNYQQWRTTVVRAKRLNQPYDQWIDEYGTTKDGTVTVHRIVRGPEGTLRLIMSLVSTQSKEDAPDEMPLTCLRWRVVYRVVPEDGELKLGQGLPDSSLTNRCEN